MFDRVRTPGTGIVDVRLPEGGEYPPLIGNDLPDWLPPLREEPPYLAAEQAADINVEALDEDPELGWTTDDIPAPAGSAPTGSMPDGTVTAPAGAAPARSLPGGTVTAAHCRQAALLLGRAAELEARMARLAAQQCAVLAELAALPQFADGEWVADEVMSVLNVSKFEAARRIQTAQLLQSHLPLTREAFWNGRIGLAHAAAVAGALADAPEPVALEADRRLSSAVAEGHPPNRLGRLAEKAAFAADAEFARKREEAARTTRSLRAYRNPDGTGYFGIQLPRVDFATTLDAIDALARRAGPEDKRTIDVRRADAFVTLVTGMAAGGSLSPAEAGPGAGLSAAGSPYRPLVGVVVPLETLAGASDAPGELLGYGPISADTARRLGCDGRLVRLATDPITGHIVEAGRVHAEPDDRLRRLVVVRDQYCQFPSCGIPAPRCHLHHIVFRSEGGPTTPHNLTALCAYHHRMVHEAGWQLRRNRDDSLTWTSPSARRRVVRPPRPAPQRLAPPRPAPQRLAPQRLAPQRR